MIIGGKLKADGRCSLTDLDDNLEKAKEGSVSFPVCGFNIKVLEDSGKECAPNKEGYVVVKLPLPPGSLMGIWNNPERFHTSYTSKFEGYYLSGDGGFVDDDGYWFITGRIDDIINVAGHRFSTADMEEIVASHPAIAECAVFGKNDAMKGQIPLGLAVLKSGQEVSEESVQADVVKLVRQKIGAVAAFKKLVVVKRLPKTRSGKILRKLLRSIVNKEEFTIPSTIDDVNIIQEIKVVFEQIKL